MEEMPKAQPPKNQQAAALARLRWAKATPAERKRQGEYGKLGGRPRSCDCGDCHICARREARQAEMRRRQAEMRRLEKARKARAR